MNTIELGKRTKFEDPELKDYSYIIDYDENASDPRRDTHIAHMICYHPRYNLGDEKEHTTLYEMLCDIVMELGLIKEDRLDRYKESELLKLLSNHKDIVFEYLYLYDHSGLSMTVGYRENMPPVGFIYQTKEETISDKVKESEWREKAEKNIKEEVALYDSYLMGDVYHYVLFYDPTDTVTDEMGNFHYDWGRKDALDLAKCSAEWDKQKKKEMSDKMIEVLKYATRTRQIYFDKEYLWIIDDLIQRYSLLDKGNVGEAETIVLDKVPEHILSKMYKHLRDSK